MNREQRIENARQTLDIIERGVYTVNDRKVNISEDVKRSINDAVLYTPEASETLMPGVAEKIAALRHQTVITITNRTTLEALCEMVSGGRHSGCLNFASAKNPGGGFLSGALAQEESLAAASSLYPSQTKFMQMYDYNRSQRTYLYSGYMIYSPGVVFIKDDEGNLLETPYQADVLTSPAVNIGAMEQNNPAELSAAERTMLSRMDKVLATFVHHNVENLVLGAWGCGVFRNDPRDIARYFAGYLTREGKYAKCFRKVVFAVFDRSKNQENINTFREAFDI